MLTRDEIRKYLDRLEYDKIPAPDLETLHALQWAHLTHVPYENIDALLGIPISLKPDDLYRKIVLEHRGGWCFELQGAYGYLLQSSALPSCSTPRASWMSRAWCRCAATAFSSWTSMAGATSQTWACAANRRENRSRSSSTRFSPMACAITSSARTIFTAGRSGRRKRASHGSRSYGFTEEPQIDDDFVMPSFWGEKHPDSTFNKFLKISIFSGETNRTLVGNVYKEYRDAKVQVRQVLETKEEIARVLLERFGLDARQK